MTYCVALKLNNGLVFASDTRTNAGVDNIAVFRKLYRWQTTGERVLVLMAAGNLAITQAVVSELEERAGREEDGSSLMTVANMFQAARLVGDAIRAVRRIDGPTLEAAQMGFTASFILGGQIGDEEPRLFQIYAEGNFIEATEDTPFLQIGEHKYGKPILDRVARPAMRLGEAAKLVLISFDSTLRSNLSVGMPIDLLLYRKNTLAITLERRIDQDDEYFRNLSVSWSESLREAFGQLKEFEM